ncbi:MAG TPA: hypothetical protein VLE96_03395 [Chlamydiales bacterium]|nr:hypothetical protein [Chlamydiales bacterium]
MKSQNPTLDVSQYEFLRMPQFTRCWDIRHYSDAIFVNDHDIFTREDLISVDGYFYNNQSYESALFFLANNMNMFYPSKQFIEAILQSFQKDLDSDQSSRLADRVLEVKAEDDSRIGNLFVICLPKEKSQEIQYRAHPLGPCCHCHSKEEDQTILEKLQNGVLDFQTGCWEKYNKIPQFRIFTPQLTQENGVKIHLIASNVSFLEKVRDKIRNVVQKIEYLKHISCPGHLDGLSPVFV